MLPNELQLNILSVLDQPRSEEDDSLTCSDMVAERLNLDLHIVEYHFGILDQEGLVKVLVDQECMGDEPRIYCVQLTPKGKVALRSPDQLVAIEQRATHTVINQNNDFRGATLGGGVAGRDYVGNVSHNTADGQISKLFSILRQEIPNLDSDNQEMAFESLSELEEELTHPTKLSQAKKLLFALWAVGKDVANFANAVTAIAERLDIHIPG